MESFSAARKECLRALDIIDQTQLTLFLQREAPPRDALLERMDALSDRGGQSIVGLRELLNDVLAIYNDPFANYIDPEQHKAYSQRRRGGFVGVGLKYRAQPDNFPIVIGPLLGGPLDNDVVSPGDRLLRAGSTALKGLASRAIADALKGPAESSIELEFERSVDQSSYRILAQRRAVELHYARSDILANDVGYIKVSRFGSDTHLRVRRLLEDLQAKSVRALILDLRDNPGGSTRAARGMLSLFDKADWVYCERYKSGKVRQLPREGSWLSDLPLVVLINEYSMSSSEILAGALQDYRRATLVGAPTYGKGLIQQVFPLKEPLGGALRTTIASYATPNHHLIHGRGLVPDVYVPSAPSRLFRESGSLNISVQARSVRRQLLEADLRRRHPARMATALIGLADTQLDVGLSTLESL